MTIQSPPEQLRNAYIQAHAAALMWERNHRALMDARAPDEPKRKRRKLPPASPAWLQTTRRPEPERPRMIDTLPGAKWGVLSKRRAIA